MIDIAASIIRPKTENASWCPGDDAWRAPALAVALFFNACGASVGTVVKPGYGPTAGQLVAGFAVDPAMKQLVKILGLAG